MTAACWGPNIPDRQPHVVTRLSYMCVIRQQILNAWWLIGFDAINHQEYRLVGNGVDINVTFLMWESNSGGMLCCVKPVMAHEQDLLFDKRRVRTDGGHISDVKHFPACKYSLDKNWQSKWTSWKSIPKKWSTIPGKAGFRGLNWMQTKGLLSTSLTAGSKSLLEVRG